MKILKPLTSIVIPRIDSQFVVEKNFLVNTKDRGFPKIIHIGDEFLDYFQKKTEEPKLRETSLHSYRLMKKSFDESIIAEFGGATHVELFVSEMFFLLNRQKFGDIGPLEIKNGEFNLFYLRDASAELRTVSAFWHRSGWHIDAYCVETPAMWHKDYCVFSHSPVLVNLEQREPTVPQQTQ